MDASKRRTGDAEAAARRYCGNTGDGLSKRREGGSTRGVNGLYVLGVGASQVGLANHWSCPSIYAGVNVQL